MLHGETNLSLDLASGVVAREFPPGPVPVPDKALGVHDQSIGHPFVIRHTGKDPAIAGRARDRVIVKDDDLAMPLIRHVNCLAIRADSNAVRRGITCIELMERSDRDLHDTTSRQAQKDLAC